MLYNVIALNITSKTLQIIFSSYFTYYAFNGKYYNISPFLQSIKIVLWEEDVILFLQFGDVCVNSV